MTRLSYLMLGLVLLASSSCKNRNQVPETAYIVFEETPCFGTCPIYKMTVHGSGLVTYNGERFSPKLGSFEKQLSAKETKELFNQVYDFSWSEFQDKYPASVSDLPSTVFEFNYKEISKKRIKVTGEHPAELDVLKSILSTLAESEGWTDLNTQ